MLFLNNSFRKIICDILITDSVKFCKLNAKTIEIAKKLYTFLNTQHAMDDQSQISVCHSPVLNNR